MPLTDAQCRNAVCPPEKKQSKLYDAGGLFLEVSPAGSKRWFLKYRHETKEKKLALGRYPDVTLTAARKARDAAKIQKVDGTDPLQARQVEKLKATVGSGDTLEATANDWLERGKPNWSDTHYVRERRNITKDLIPYLGKRSIGSIKPIELLAVIQKVEARGALDMAHRVHITAHGVWCHAVATGRAERDITPDIKKALKPHIKENLPAIIDPVQLAGLLRAMEGYSGGPVVRAALKMAPILFQRPGNLRTMRWADLNLDAGTWTIPSEDMKRTKAENERGPFLWTGKLMLFFNLSGEPMKRIPRRIFTEEFKREAIKLVIDQGLTLAEASRKLDVDPKSVRTWIAQPSPRRTQAQLGRSQTHARSAKDS